MEAPETRYVAVGDADVAYQVLGEGPLDLLYSYGLGSHIELFWQSPALAEFPTRLASFSRLILFDRRGSGASDGVPRTAIPTWEQWTEDIVAVLGAAGSKRTAILAGVDAGVGEGAEVAGPRGTAAAIRVSEALALDRRGGRRYRHRPR